MKEYPILHSFALHNLGPLYYYKQTPYSNISPHIMINDPILLQTNPYSNKLTRISLIYPIVALPQITNPILGRNRHKTLFGPHILVKFTPY